MHGSEHLALRKSFLALFTRKALGAYVVKQAKVLRGAMQEWLHSSCGAAGSRDACCAAAGSAATHMHDLQRHAKYLQYL